jgi:hypothetical protein
MTRRHAFTQADVSRALKGAKAAGIDARIFIARDTGDLVIEPMKAANFESDLDRWKAGRRP